jgi:regulator of Ty1 transposition protein 103
VTTVSAVPSELAPLVPLQQNLTKQATPAKTAVNAANGEYDNLANGTSPAPAPAVHAARLTGLLKNLASAEGAVTECIKARKELVSALEKILIANREALKEDEAQLDLLRQRSLSAETQKKEVELAIIGGFPLDPVQQSPGGHSSGSPVPEFDPPQVEALTPPHVQDHEDAYDHATDAHNGHGQPLPMMSNPPAAYSSAPGIEMLSNLASQYQAVPTNGSKKRKLDTDDFPDLGGDDGIDADVAEMLRKDSNAT